MSDADGKNQDVNGKDEAGVGEGVKDSCETIPAGDDDDFLIDEEVKEDSQNGWGLLNSRYPGTIPHLKMTKQSYMIGRNDEKSAIVLKRPPKNDGTRLRCFLAYSRQQFEIYRDEDGQVHLLDLSSNGTFVNGRKVGTNFSIPLTHNCEISMGFPRNRAFVFVDMLQCNGGREIPPELEKKFIFSHVVGRGACGEVRCAYDRNDGNAFAIKIVSKEKCSMFGDSETEDGVVKGSPHHQAIQEAKILLSLKHPNVIRMMKIYDNYEKNVFLVLEFVRGGELFDKIKSGAEISNRYAVFVFTQIFRAVEYLHANNVVHRDLKPENILISSQEDDFPVVKVSDFGLSKIMDAEKMLKSYVGTPTYMAPEIIRSMGSGYYTEKVDVWSLGAVLFCFVTGYPPFTTERTDVDDDVQKQILDGNYLVIPRIWRKVDKKCRKLIKSMLVVDGISKQRFSVSECLQHEWISSDAETRKLVDKVTEMHIERFRCAYEAHEPKRKNDAALMSPPASPKKKKMEAAAAR